MSTLPGNLKDLLPARLVLKEDIRFVEDAGQIYGEWLEKETEFQITEWQYHAMTGMDGTRTLEELIDEARNVEGGGPTSEDWLQFYAWLYQEHIIRVFAPSIFELCEVEEDEVAVATEEPKLRVLPHSETVSLLNPRTYRVPKWLRISATFAFWLCLLRLSYVVAPILEPAVDRMYEKAESFAAAAPELRLPISREKSAPMTVVSERDFSGSGRVLSEVDILREKLEGCRIRRDEYYIQNNEDGYRREVAAMTELARQIGEAESKY